MINQAADNAYNLLENLLEWSRYPAWYAGLRSSNLMLFKEVEHQMNQSS